MASRSKSWTPYKLLFPPKPAFCTLFWNSNSSVAPSLGLVSRTLTWHHNQKKKKSIVIPEEDPDDWPDVGPQNPEEAVSYIEKVNNIFEMMAENVLHDKKDALPSAVRSLKKLMSRHWPSVGDADPDVVI